MKQKISDIIQNSELIPIALTNTLSRKKEIFTPIVPGEVCLYTCGPTVYNEPQIGNLRAYVFSDTLRRMFEANNFAVRQVINITDVGHLVSDADSGDDKMEKAARERGLSATAVAEMYTTLFFENLTALNIRTEGTEFPRATGFIAEQIALIQTLEEKGYTYTTSDGVYFNTARFPRYGALGGINLEGLQAGARVAFSDEKKNPTDFALWKVSPQDGLKREQEWDSPWGTGFPGWHIECSAMSRALLGVHIDIHTGGIDHIPVHHNNEIAQSECASGETFANIWMHNAFLTINGARIGKSVGNAITLRELIADGYDPRALRYLYLTGHYSTPMDFAYESLKGAETALKRLQKYSEVSESGIPVESTLRDVLNAFNDDLNTAKGIALVWEMLSTPTITQEDKSATLIVLESLLGLGLGETQEVLTISEEVQKFLDERKSARADKNWKESDRLRDVILGLGFLVKDTDAGQIVEKA